ncbi:hypothetical protein HDU81_011104 [Chytriomyces hyalinus]|nr:hypothetical protein HDU81_011104 [Chytriomyces hyalinus]
MLPDILPANEHVASSLDPAGEEEEIPYMEKVVLSHKSSARNNSKSRASRPRSTRALVSAAERNQRGIEALQEKNSIKFTADMTPSNRIVATTTAEKVQKIMEKMASEMLQSNVGNKHAVAQSQKYLLQKLKNPEKVFAHRHYFALHPTCNMILAKRWEEKCMQQHHQRLKQAKPSIDNLKPRAYPHLEMRLKGVQIEEERLHDIERKNHILLDRISFQMLNPSEVSSLHVRLEEDNTRALISDAVDHRRKREKEKITKENSLILQRIEDKSPNYNRCDWSNERRKNLEHLANIAKYPSHYIKILEEYAQQFPPGRKFSFQTKTRSDKKQSGDDNNDADITSDAEAPEIIEATHETKEHSKDETTMVMAEPEEPLVFIPASSKKVPSKPTSQMTSYTSSKMPSRIVSPAVISSHGHQDQATYENDFETDVPIENATRPHSAKTRHSQPQSGYTSKPLSGASTQHQLKTPSKPSKAASKAPSAVRSSATPAGAHSRKGSEADSIDDWNEQIHSQASKSTTVRSPQSRAKDPVHHPAPTHIPNTIEETIGSTDDGSQSDIPTVLVTKAASKGASAVTSDHGLPSSSPSRAVSKLPSAVNVDHSKKNSVAVSRAASRLASDSNMERNVSKQASKQVSKAPTANEFLDHELPSATLSKVPSKVASEGNFDRDIRQASKQPSKMPSSTGLSPNAARSAAMSKVPSKVPSKVASKMPSEANFDKKSSKAPSSHELRAPAPLSKVPSKVAAENDADPGLNTQSKPGTKAPSAVSRRPDVASNTSSKKGSTHELHSETVVHQKIVSKQSTQHPLSQSNSETQIISKTSSKTKLVDMPHPSRLTSKQASEAKSLTKSSASPSPPPPEPSNEASSSDAYADEAFEQPVEEDAGAGHDGGEYDEHDHIASHESLAMAIDATGIAAIDSRTNLRASRESTAAGLSKTDDGEILPALPALT